MNRVLATRPDVQAAEKATQPTVVHLRKPRRDTPSAAAGFGAAPAAAPVAAFDRGAGAACTPDGEVAAVMGGVGTGAAPAAGSLGVEGSFSSAIQLLVVCG